jgi:hypothetical protein
MADRRIGLFIDGEASSSVTTNVRDPFTEFAEASDGISRERIERIDGGLHGSPIACCQQKARVSGRVRGETKDRLDAGRRPFARLRPHRSR